MEIHDSVRVSAPPEVVWSTFLDVERVAPCLPGAQLDEIEGEELRGRVKVKVGPIQAQYRGTASLARVDEGEHRLVISASGRDTRGQGNAAATITVHVAAEDDGDAGTADGGGSDGGSIVTIDTDLTVTGRVAQVGRGVLGDVSSKLLGQFAENVETLWAVEPEADASGGPTGGQEAKTGGGRPASAVPRTEPEAVDLVELGGAAVARRLVPIALVGIVIAFVWWIRHRSRKRP